MTVITTLLSAALLGLGSAQAASGSQCTTKFSGILSTNQFEDSSGKNVFRPYALNYRGEVSYYRTTKHDLINAEFQTCTPNYAGEPNGADDDQLYGRIYIPSSKTCLAVTNPSGNPPYYLASKSCISSASGEMKTTKSIPFNFVADGSGGDVDIRWLGGTIPSKKIYQGPSPPAQYCFGQYFVNSTNLQHGFNFDGLGEPNTSGSTAEAYRIHLYCGNKKGGKGSTGFNSFTLLPADQLSN
ncbi:hypothetical protein FRC09_017141 [Ceratobasidium sp. 395]|nr:hypothetical protein FRC09_017141 [Ceratobasidium sp. 395]